MSEVFRAIALAIAQLTDGAVLKVLFKSVALTLLAFIALSWGLWLAIDVALGQMLVPFLPDDYEGPAAAVLAFFLSVVLFWLTFRMVALAVLQFFADEIVTAVETKHYPGAANSARSLPLHREIANSAKGIARTLFWNVLALPVAAVLFFTAIGAPLVFLLVNAVLLGRELTDMAWLRHCGGEPAENPVSGLRRVLLGGLVTAIMLVPIANLLASVIGAAAGTHLTHRAMAERAHLESDSPDA